MPSRLQLKNLQLAAQSALMCEQATEVPAELTVAQWAVESGWGAHAPGNNCFGIKAYPDCEGVQLLETSEVYGGVVKRVQQEFATFKTLAACFQKHATLICHGKPYQQVWQRYQQSRKIADLIEGIAPIYATSPHYSVTLLTVISTPEVEAAIAQARPLPPTN